MHEESRDDSASDQAPQGEEAEVALSPARVARRVGVSVAGATLVGAGTAMLVLPGPGLLTIAAGMAVLGTEYPWARRKLDEVKNRVRSATSRDE